jgi:aspartate racemase
MVYYHRRPPVVVKEDFTAVLPLQLDPDFRQAAQWLGERVDFLILCANGPHVLQAELEQAAGHKVLSMIETTLEEVLKRRWSKVGVLGFGDERVVVYTQPLSQKNLSYETIGAELQTRLNAAVISLMEGRENSESTRVIQEAVAELRSRGVDGIILGCTELPLLLAADAEAEDLINPVQLLAEAAVRHALE